MLSKSWNDRRQLSRSRPKHYDCNKMPWLLWSRMINGLTRHELMQRKDKSGNGTLRRGISMLRYSLDSQSWMALCWFCLDWRIVTESEIPNIGSGATIQGIWGWCETDRRQYSQIGRQAIVKSTKACQRPRSRAIWRRQYHYQDKRTVCEVFRFS